ncbi:hypothetical protein, partial [Hallella sp.]|uniref:hypothetical protein n=1 Tax=Hallella sp. TaxID=2980186 RepID=UPI00307B9B01
DRFRIAFPQSPLFYSPFPIPQYHIEPKSAIRFQFSLVFKKPSTPEKQATGKATRGSPKYLRMLNCVANALKKETTRRLSKYSCYL